MPLFEVESRLTRLSVQSLRYSLIDLFRRRFSTSFVMVLWSLSLDVSIFNFRTKIDGSLVIQWTKTSKKSATTTTTSRHPPVRLIAFELIRLITIKRGLLLFVICTNFRLFWHRPVFAPIVKVHRSGCYWIFWFMRVRVYVCAKSTSSGSPSPDKTNEKKNNPTNQNGQRQKTFTTLWSIHL